MLKFIFFAFIFYMLVRFISNRFLPGDGRKKSNFRVFYQTFKNVRNQQKQHEEQSQNRNGKVKKNDLDNIEEAEYEDVTDDNAEKS